MAIIDNSKTNQMNSPQIKEVLNSTIRQSVEKSVLEAAYDKTILATIQCCNDVSLGQYKIKYQDSYFTAYAKDISKKYSNNAIVYVLIPGNDMTKRMFITGLANDDFNQQSSLDNLELDQQFTNRSTNIITVKPGANLDLSTYWDAPDVHVKTLYKYDKEEDEITNNYLTVNNELFLNYINQLDEPYIRFGCSFKTTIDEDRKNQGDYGIRLRLKFKDGDYKDYVISTYNMSGSPFNFSSFVPQYNIWSIDKDNFERIETIEAFTQGFPQSSDTPITDIFLADLSLMTCQRIFDVVSDNTTVADIVPLDGNIFGNVGETEPKTTLQFKGRLIYKGNEITDTLNKLEVYWGREDTTVNSVGHPKYNSYLGPGWYCLNTANRLKPKDGDDRSDLENPTIDITDESNAQGDFEWNSQPIITLNKSLFYGKKTNLKCVIIYENYPYPCTLEVTNKDGLYLLMQTENGFDTFYNRQGTSTIVAGVFEDIPNSDTPEPHLFEGIWEDGREYRIEYKWTKEEAVTPRIRKSLPLNTSEYYPSSPYDKDNATWRSDLDNENKTEEEVETYFTQYFPNEIDRDIAKRCIERYEYYERKNNTYAESTNPEDVDKLQRCKDRLYGTDGPPEILGIIPENKEYVQKLYISEYNNDGGFYILGPSTFTGVYDEAKKASDRDYQNYYNYASIDTGSIVHHYYGTGLYNSEQTNTLYKVNGYTIGAYTDFTVTAFISFLENNIVTETHSIGTETIRLTNAAGNNLKYTLQIVNGDRVFSYDEDGLLTTGVQYLPLSFKLINQQGTVLFDSSNENSGNENINLTTLAPKWRFPYKETLLNVFYRPESENMSENDIICYKNNNTYVVKNQPFFNYKVSDNFNVNYKDNNIIELEVQFDNSVISASTNFSFIKQGEMGTNGTDYNLLIRDMNYDQNYKPILADDNLSTFVDIITDENGTEIDEEETYIIGPSNRHLNNVYLYATHCYENDINWDPSQSGATAIEDSGTDITNIGNDNVRYVNLQFSGNPTEDRQGIIGQRSVVLQTQVFENGRVLDITNNDSNNKPVIVTWTDLKAKKNQFINDKDNPEDSTCNQPIKIDNTPSFTVATDNLNLPNAAELTINPIKGDTRYGIKPSFHYDRIDSQNGTDVYIYDVANNIVQSKANIYVPTQDASRDIYTFYGIPFYYFAVHRKKQDNSWENVTSSTLDPARHIVVTGGFDDIIYNEAGANPIYNKQNDFKVYLFDEEGRSILDESLLKNRNDTTVKWQCSPSLVPAARPVVTNYEDFKNNEDLYGKYCLYNSKVYYCTEHHKKDGAKEIKSGDEVIQKYESGAFVDAYWKQVKSIGFDKQVQKFTPRDTYASFVQSSLLNDWICVTVTTTEIEKNGETYKYNAQAFIPINALCNPYGSQILNDWNGKSTVIDDERGYILTRQVAAGHKTNLNKMVGITIGDNFYNSEGNDVGTPVTGIFGYGDPDNNGNVVQTLFIDANTGRSVFGVESTGQIIFDTKPPESKDDIRWNRLGGWYFNKDYLYKPYGVADSGFSLYDFMTKNDPIEPPDSDKGAGLYVPMEQEPAETDAFIWAGADYTKENRNAAKFYVTYGGKLHCDIAELTGDITATSGSIGPLQVVSSTEVSIKNGDKTLFKAIGGNTPQITINGSIGVKKGLFTNNEYTDAQREKPTLPMLKDVKNIFINQEAPKWRMINKNEKISVKGTRSETDVNDYIYPDESGAMIPYALYNANLSMPLEPKGHVESNDPDFNTKAGQSVFFKGDLYALGGRIANWIFDVEKISTPNVKLDKSGNVHDSVYVELYSGEYDQTPPIGNYGTHDYRRNVGYISVGRYNGSASGDAYKDTVTMWSDGSIEGQHDPGNGEIVERSWLIKGTGVADFTLSRATDDSEGSKFKGQFWTNNYVKYVAPIPGTSPGSDGVGSILNNDGLTLDMFTPVYLNDRWHTSLLSFSQDISTNKVTSIFSGPVNIDEGTVRLSKEGIFYDNYFGVSTSGYDTSLLLGSSPLAVYNSYRDSISLTSDSANIGGEPSNVTGSLSGIINSQQSYISYGHEGYLTIDEYVDHKIRDYLRNARLVTGVTFSCNTSRIDREDVLVSDSQGPRLDVSYY